MSYTLPLARLIEVFQKLPGIGPKSAQRLAFHVLKLQDSDVHYFAQVLLEAKSKIGHCETCFNLSGQTPCELCSNMKRNRRTICVVSEPRDVFALERTGEYSGSYHVLGGLISPMEGISPEDLRIKELIARLATSALPPVAAVPTYDFAGGGDAIGYPAIQEAPVQDTSIEEIILAIPPSIEGDTTSLYLAKLIKPLDIKLSRIAFGLPVGGDLEYADSLTITRALQGRHIL